MLENTIYILILIPYLILASILLFVKLGDKVTIWNYVSNTFIIIFIVLILAYSICALYLCNILLKSFIITIIYFGINLIMLSIITFQEYIISKKIHEEMIYLNEKIPETYKRFCHIETGLALIFVYVIDLIFNFKYLIKIIKKEPLNMYF